MRGLESGHRVTGASYVWFILYVTEWLIWIDQFVLFRARMFPNYGFYLFLFIDLTNAVDIR